MPLGLLPTGAGCYSVQREIIGCTVSLSFKFSSDMFQVIESFIWNWKGETCNR